MTISMARAQFEVDIERHVPSHCAFAHDLIFKAVFMFASPSFEARHHQDFSRVWF
jgi:hypothetical protein